MRDHQAVIEHEAIQVRDTAGNSALFLRDVHPSECTDTTPPTRAIVPIQRVAPLADGTLAGYWGELLVPEIDVEAWELAGWQLGWITVPPATPA